MEHALGEHAKDGEARQLYLQEMLESKAAYLSNRSTSAGQELLKDAEVAALAEKVRNTPGAATKRGLAWDSVRARLTPPSGDTKETAPQ